MRGLWRKVQRSLDRLRPGQPYDTLRPGKPYDALQPKLDPRDAMTLKVAQDAWERFTRDRTITGVFTEVGEDGTVTVTETRD